MHRNPFVVLTSASFGLLANALTLFDQYRERVLSDLLSARRIRGRFPLDLRPVLDRLLDAGIQYCADVLGPPMVKHLHFDIVREWARHDVRVSEMDLLRLRDVMIRADREASKLKVRLFKLYWSGSFLVETPGQFENIAAMVSRISRIMSEVRALDTEKLDRWRDWRELTVWWDDAVRQVLEQNGQSHQAGFF